MLKSNPLVNASTAERLTTSIVGNLRKLPMAWGILASILVVSLAVGVTPQNSVALTFKTAFQDDKSPVPSKSEQRNAAKLIKELFKSQFTGNSLEAKTSLATELLKQGTQPSNDPASRYVCLQQAQTLAAEIEQVDIAIKAVDALSDGFDTDTTELRLDCISKFSRASKNSGHMEKFVEWCKPWVESRIAADDYKSAIGFSKKFLSAARKSASPRTLDGLKMGLDRMKILDRRYDELVVKNEAILKTNPQDELANRAIGEFYCLYKGDFERGLPYFARGTDSQERRLAKQELAESDDTQDLLLIADGWWEMAAEKSDNEQLKSHSVGIYKEIVAELKGIRLAQVKKRIFWKTQGELLRIVESKWKMKWIDSTYDEVEFYPDGSMRVEYGPRGTLKFNWEITEQGIVFHIPRKIVITPSPDGRGAIGRKYSLDLKDVIDKITCERID